MKIWYVRIKLENIFGPSVNRANIKKLEKKLPKLNKKIDRLNEKARKMQKDLQNAYLDDSINKMEKEGRY